jgi:hypothetical protein
MYAGVPYFSKIMERAEATLGKDSAFYLFLKIYNLAPSRDDFQKLKIVRSEHEAKGKSNFMVVPQSRPQRSGMLSPVPHSLCRILIREFKTDKSHSDRNIMMDTEVSELIKGFIKNNNLDYGKFLFGKTALSSFVGKNLAKVGIIVKGQNINLLRHAHSAEWRKDHPNPTAEEEVAHANKYSHGVHTNRLYTRQIV